MITIRKSLLSLLVLSGGLLFAVPASAHEVRHDRERGDCACEHNHHHHGHHAMMRGHREGHHEHFAMHHGRHHHFAGRGEWGHERGFAEHREWRMHRRFAEGGEHGERHHRHFAEDGRRGEWGHHRDFSWSGREGGGEERGWGEMRRRHFAFIMHRREGCERGGERGEHHMHWRQSWSEDGRGGPGEWHGRRHHHFDGDEHRAFDPYRQSWSDRHEQDGSAVVDDRRDGDQDE